MGHLGTISSSVITNGAISKVRKFDYALLFIAFLNNILKVGIDSDLTLFRLFIPLYIYRLYKLSPAKFRVWILTVSFVLIYGSIIGYSYVGSWHPYLVFHIFHYFNLILFIMYSWTVIKQSNLELVTTINKFRWVIIVMCWLQYVTKLRFANLIDRGDDVMWLFLGNENDLSNVLVCFTVLFAAFTIQLDGSKKDRSYNLVFILNAVAILMINGSRLSLFAIAVFVVLRYFHKKGKLIFILAPLAVLVSLIFSDKIVDSIDPFLEPVENILFLNSYSSSATSSHYRVNAIITVIKSLADFNFLGLGPGLSRYAAEYGLKVDYASSVHNIFIEFFVEFGVFALIAVIYFFRWIFIKLRAGYYGISLILPLVISFSSLGGSFYTNYLAIFLVVFVLYMISIRHKRIS